MADDASQPKVDPALLEEARANGVDVEAVIESALRRELALQRVAAEESAGAEAFARANADFIQAYRDLVEREGVWSEQWRSW